MRTVKTKFIGNEWKSKDFVNLGLFILALSPLIGLGVVILF